MAQIALYPRRGTTFLDANGTLITSAGRYCEESAYISDAISRGDLLTVDPYEVYQPDDVSVGEGANKAPIDAQYVVASADSDLTGALVLKAGNNITLTQGAGTMTIAAAGGGGGTGGGAPTDAEYLVSAASSGLSAERVLTAGANITLTPTTGALTVAAANVAPNSASYVTLGTNGTLTSERVLTAGANITITDGGAGGAVTIAATGTGAPVGASYLTTAADPTLTNEKVLTAGTGITLTPGSGTMTISSTGGGAPTDANYAIWGGTVPASLPSARLVGFNQGIDADTTTPGILYLNAAKLYALTSVVMSTPAGVNQPPNTRKLTAGSNVTITDGGPNGNVTISASGVAASSASFLTLGTDASLANERTLVAGSNISFVDSGPSGTLTINASGGAGGTSGFLNVLDSGVRRGALANDSERGVNRTNFNNAITSAASSQKTLIVPPGRYEIAGGALLITTDGFSWVGTQNTQIVQYTLSVPVVHIGPPRGTANTSIEAVSFIGAYLQYNGTATSASGGALECTGLWMSNLQNIDIGDRNGLAGRTSVPYRCIYLDGTAGTVVCFSNTWQNIRCKHFVYRGIDAPRPGFDAGSTGSVWTNVYVSGGDGAGQQDTSVTSGAMPVYFEMQTQLVINQLNVEWLKAECLIYMNVCSQVEITGINLEGCTLKNAAPAPAAFLRTLSCRGEIRGLTIYNCTATTANNVSMTSVFESYDDSWLDVRNSRIDSTTKTTTTTPNFAFVRAFGGGSNTNVRFDVGNLHFGNAHGLDAMDAFSFSGGTVGELFGELADFNNHSVWNAADANLTVYTYHQPANIRLPATTARTVSLAKTLEASETCTIPRGVTRRIRHSGSAGTITVQNAGVAFSPAIALSAGQFVDVAFDGSNWVAI